MRIGIDCRMVTHPGIGRYIDNLVRGLLCLDFQNEYVIFSEHNFLDPHLAGRICFEKVTYPIYSLQEQWGFAFRLKNLDMYHVPHYNIPLWYYGSAKLVVTIHDLIHLLFPQYLRWGFAKYYAYVLLKSATHKASRVIAVSENTKKDIQKILRIDPGKIEVIHEAASPCMARVSDKALCAQVTQKYSLPKQPYVLFIGSLRYHKNVVKLINAFCRLKNQYGGVHHLVLGGRFDKKAKAIHQILNDPSMRQWIHYVGEVREEDLAALYSMADVFVFPSLYEGFGLPPLEALRIGIPVCASNVSSIPEVLGNAAEYFNPYREEEIINALWGVMNSVERKQDLIRKGYARAEQFSWTKTAEQTLAVYEKVME